MQKIDVDELFKHYPNLSNIDELKKADILIMPYHYYSGFSPDQDIFKDLALKPDVNCLFYSENQEEIIYRLQESANLEDILHFGEIVVIISQIIRFYIYLRDGNQIKNKKFRIEKHIIHNDDIYWEIEGFEGDIEQYKEFIQETKKSIGNSMDK